MPWYYTQIYPNGSSTKGTYVGTIAPLNSKRITDYEFGELTDPTLISNMNQAVEHSDPNKDNQAAYGPFDTLAEAQAKAAQFPPETLQQSIDNSRPNIPIVTPALNAASGIVSTGINATGAGINLINALTQASTWIRIAEVVLGLVLIAVGVARLTNAVPLATKTARTAAKIGKVFA